LVAPGADLATSPPSGEEASVKRIFRRTLAADEEEEESSRI
jgi:hypothetical protein